MTNTMKLRIVTPESTFYEDDVDMVTLTGVDGEMGLLPQHIRMMTQMVPGELVVRKDGRDQFLAVGEGLVEVSSDRVDIITDMAVTAENIDEAKAEEARQRGSSPSTRKDLFRRSGFRQFFISSLTGTTARQASPFEMTLYTARRTCVGRSCSWRPLLRIFSTLHCFTHQIELCK